MPELPEKDITRQGIEPHLLDQSIKQVPVYQWPLLWTMPKQIKHLKDQPMHAVDRCDKCILIKTPVGDSHHREKKRRPSMDKTLDS